MRDAVPPRPGAPRKVRKRPGFLEAQTGAINSRSSSSVRTISARLRHKQRLSRLARYLSYSWSSKLNGGVGWHFWLSNGFDPLQQGFLVPICLRLQAPGYAPKLDLTSDALNHVDTDLD